MSTITEIVNQEWPLEVRLVGGRVRHSAKLPRRTLAERKAMGGSALSVEEGDIVITLCGKRGRISRRQDGYYCAACDRKPNPISQASGMPATRLQ